jgi:hypothetical protein
MRRSIFLALLAAPLAALPAGAAPPPPDSPGVALIAGWVHQYLGRAPNRDDIQNGLAIDAGDQDPTDRLTQILACDEYYQRRGRGDDYRYVQALFADVAGRQPTRREADYWVRRLRLGPEGMDGRLPVAAELLQRYPPDLTALSAPEDYPYRRPDYRDRDRYRDWDRDRR